MRPVLCVCAEIPKLETGVRLVLLMHVSELKSTTNTGRLAAYAFPHAEIRVRGRRGEPMTSEGLVTPERQALLLYPSDDSHELDSAFVARLDKPVTLLVPDGTWRQAAKVAKREAALAGVPRIRLPVGRPTAYHLRQSPSPHNVSTLEAIARAMAVLDGPESARRLEALFKLVVERTLWSRGMLALKHCRDSIPAAALLASE